MFRARADRVSATHEGGQVIRAAVFADQPGVKGGERRCVQKRVGRRPPWWQKRHGARGQARVNEARPAIAVSHWIPYPRAGRASEPKLRAALAPSIPVVATTVTAGHGGACGAGSKHTDQPRRRICGDPRGPVWCARRRRREAARCLGGRCLYFCKLAAKFAILLCAGVESPKQILTPARLGPYLHPV